jgi:hypothetical protein
MVDRLNMMPPRANLSGYRLKTDGKELRLIKLFPMGIAQHGTV